MCLQYIDVFGSEAVFVAPLFLSQICIVLSALVEFEFCHMQSVIFFSLSFGVFE